MQDRWIAIVLSLLMAGLLWNAQSMPDPKYEPLGARFLAELVPATILVLALALLARSFLRPQATVSEPSVSVSDFLTGILGRLSKTIQIFACLVVYVIALELKGGIVGYLAATIVFFCVMAGLLLRGNAGTNRDRILVVAVACTLAFGIAWLFHEYLNVSLP